MSDEALATREGLPDALRVLLEDYPRSGWTADPGFNELIRFWLERHLMFRDVMGRMIATCQTRLDSKGDPQRFRAEISHYGGFFVNQLHQHHMVEDQHYFPQLQGLDTRISRGFDILDADHHAIDANLNDFVTGANALLQIEGDGSALRDETGRFLRRLDGMQGLLDRHLTDEEELVVPVILKYGADNLH